MRKALEVTFDARSDGASFRQIADKLSEKTGIPVSHESVRQWLKAG